MRFDVWKRRRICGLFWVKNKCTGARNVRQILPSYIDRGRSKAKTQLMTEHITTSLMQRFRVRALPVGELNSIAKHLDVCPSCNQQFAEILQSRRWSEPVKITLAPEFQFRHEHVDYEQLVRLADMTMDASER